MLRVVPADLADAAHADALVTLLDLYAQDPMGGGDGLSDYTRDHLVPRLRDRANTVIVLAFVDDAPVGLVVCFEGFSTFAALPLLNVHDIVVAPLYRGQGIAARMLGLVESIAVGRGCCKLTLEVLESNDAAQAAYQRFGFRPYQLAPELGSALFWEKKLPIAGGNRHNSSQ